MIAGATVYYLVFITLNLLLVPVPQVSIYLKSLTFFNLI